MSDPPPAVPFFSYVLGLYEDSLSEKSLQRPNKAVIISWLSKQLPSLRQVLKVMQASGDFAKCHWVMLKAWIPPDSRGRGD